MESAVQRLLEETLRLGTAHACGELVRVSLNVLDRCQRDGIDPDLDGYLSCSRKRCDSLTKVSHEPVEFDGGHGSINAAVALGDVSGACVPPVEIHAVSYGGRSPPWKTLAGALVRDESPCPRRRPPG
jgi:hypothetical protein